MKPGQLSLNEFEVAILEHIAKDEPSIRLLIPQLRVLSRKFTGVGSYATLDCHDSSPDLEDRPVGHPNITMPDVPNSMGAVLFCEIGKPKTLETYTYGDEHWDGNYEGFSIDKAA